MVSGLTESASELTAQLQGKRFVSAEFMYKPRPSDPQRQRVFDLTLASRLTELARYENSAVVFPCNDQATADSLAYLQAKYPTLLFLMALVNPQPVASPDPYAATPVRCGWDQPERWQRFNLTDRWARILFALDIAHQLTRPGYLMMPAHDAVWGNGLIAKLANLSHRYAKNGLDAAVSPYTPHQHSPVPGVDIPPEIIAALNAAFARDSWLRWRLARGRYQSFWGKMGMIPFGMAGDILRRVETMVWEDDLELDRVVRKAGFGLRCLWVSRPALYRQSPPVFNRDDLKAVIERTLHYSLNIPGKFPGEKSRLNRPLDRIGRIQRRLSRRFARAVTLSETLIAECSAEAAERVKRYGASWVDWGAYRYVVTVGDPQVQVWKNIKSVL